MQIPILTVQKCNLNPNTKTSLAENGSHPSKVNILIMSPVDGKAFTKVPRSSVEDIELALDAAHAAKQQWNNSSPTTRSNILLKSLTDLRRILNCWQSQRPGITVSRSEKPWQQIFLSRLTIFVILPAVFAPKKVEFPKLMKTPLPTIFMNL